jgi:hypothetical protein
MQRKPHLDQYNILKSVTTALQTSSRALLASSMSVQKPDCMITAKNVDSSEAAIFFQEHASKATNYQRHARITLQTSCSDRAQQHCLEPTHQDMLVPKTKLIRLLILRALARSP